MCPRADDDRCPTLFIAHHEFPVQITGCRSVQTNVQGLDTVVEDEYIVPVVEVIDGREQQGVAHYEARMLPGTVDMVVVVLVDGRYLLGQGGRSVVIDGAALVFREQEL